MERGTGTIASDQALKALQEAYQGVAGLVGGLGD
jgi:hypothetical protein